MLATHQQCITQVKIAILALFREIILKTSMLK